MQTNLLKSYNKTELSEKENTPYSRIDKDKWLYIPIKIETAQTRIQKKWYTVRYVRTEDVKNYLQENPIKNPNEKKFKKLLKK